MIYQYNLIQWQPLTTLLFGTKQDAISCCSWDFVEKPGIFLTLFKEFVCILSYIF